MSPQKARSQSGVESKREVRANQISMLKGRVFLQAGATSKGVCTAPLVSAAMGPQSVSTGPELSLMKCLSSLEPLKRRSFKALIIFYLRGKVFSTSDLKQNPAKTHKQDQRGGPLRPPLQKAPAPLCLFNMTPNGQTSQSCPSTLCCGSFPPERNIETEN